MTAGAMCRTTATPCMPAAAVAAGLPPQEEFEGGVLRLRAARGANGGQGARVQRLQRFSQGVAWSREAAASEELEALRAEVMIEEGIMPLSEVGPSGEEVTLPT